MKRRIQILVVIERTGSIVKISGVRTVSLSEILIWYLDGLLLIGEVDVLALSGIGVKESRLEEAGRGLVAWTGAFHWRVSLVDVGGWQGRVRYIA